MKNRYSTIKYHGYVIEGVGKQYELYHPDGLIGTFTTCQEAKAYVNRERKEADKAWNRAVMEDTF